MTLNAKWTLYIMPSIYLLLLQIGGGDGYLPFQSVLFDIILCNFRQSKSKPKSLPS